jgi:hypothetical protein
MNHPTRLLAQGDPMVRPAQSGRLDARSRQAGRRAASVPPLASRDLRVRIDLGRRLDARTVVRRAAA